MDSPASGPGNDGATGPGGPAPGGPAPGGTAAPAGTAAPRAVEVGASRVPAAVLRSWDQAEAKLFPLVMARPDVYERALRMITDLAARLRDTCPDVPALLAAHERGADLVAEPDPGIR